ncbi:esterase [Flavipsychrobacter stenotrophus]|uniref:Esterase n=1 Tax=Flavipsychrobacter stenotrophus TaxID=2077091 RepID=A0A2S7T052_9BACT|nr:alpha/beta hydrolase-fold protein [Flavipsychrobacter stenotrophus]PQJ12570.1 esterase [Flavipsychrobacter stenotrophus]
MKRPTLLLLSILVSLIATAQKPFVLGETVEIQSKELGEKRVLNIYLPEGYKKSDTARYRVIYLLDGSGNEDFPHIAGLVQFYEMMRLMPKTIVVGIANVDRKRDFTYPVTVAIDKKKPQDTGKAADLKAFFEQAMQNPKAGHSEKFMAFVEKELQPYVTSHYRTGLRTIIGQSLGGLMATEFLVRKPLLFDDYIIVSPSLWWNYESLLRLVDPQKISGKTVYIAVGHEGDVMEHDAHQLADKLKENKSANIIFRPFERETHATILHNAVYEAFRALYGKNYMGEE